MEGQWRGNRVRRSQQPLRVKTFSQQQLSLITMHCEQLERVIWMI
jgi:hypothetical protein